MKVWLVRQRIAEKLKESERKKIEKSSKIEGSIHSGIIFKEYDFYILAETLSQIGQILPEDDIHRNVLAQELCTISQVPDDIYRAVEIKGLENNEN